jgi:hypothetical protein
VTARAVPIALALLLVFATPAAAAEISVAVDPDEGVRLGTSIDITGQATEAGAPLADRTVRLEVRAHPFTGRWTPRGEAVTGADGRFAFAESLKRNHQVRAVLVGAPPAPDVVSPLAKAYVLPAFTLTFDQAKGRRILLRQVYTVPKSVRLSAPTRFYVGPCKPDKRDECTAKRAPFSKQAETRRVRKGRYVARATVRIPAAFKGRFTYVSCFGYSEGSGMGNPDLRCPRKSVRLSE